MIIALRQPSYELAHRGEYLAVVGRRCEHELAVLKGTRYALGAIGAREVEYLAMRARGVELVFERDCRFFRMTVDRSIRYHHAVGFGRIARPFIVKPEVMPEVVREHGAVQRTDRLYLEPGELFEQGLDLRAVLADYTYIIAPRLVVPRLVAVERAELAEPVRRVQRAVGCVELDHDFGPVHHGREDEFKLAVAEVERVAVLDRDKPFGRFLGIELGEILREHDERLAVADNLDVGEYAHELGDGTGVIGLHVRHDQIIGAANTAFFILASHSAENL